MQFFLFLTICKILVVASCMFFKEKVTDLQIMEEFLEVVNSDSEKQNVVEKHEIACQNLYTVVHWAFWFESFVRDENTKEPESKEKCTKNCCQKLQNFLKEKVNDNVEDEFKQFLENVIKNVENPGNISFKEMLEQFKVQKKFEIEIAEEIHSLKKLEEAKKKKFEKTKEKEKIKKLFDAENKKVENFVGTVEENLRNMYSLFDSIRECETLVENKGKKGNEELEKVRGRLDTKISQLKWSERFNGKISQQLQTLKEAARKIHEKFSLETNAAVDKKLDKQIKSARDAVAKIEETIQTKRQILYGVHEDDDGTKYDSDEGLKSSAQFLLSDINDLVKLKKKLCECPAKIVKKKKEFAKKREELGKEIHSFPMQLKKAEFYMECLPLQPEIENMHKRAVEEYNAGINLENKVFYESKKKLEGIFNNLLEIAKNAIASTFGHNCQFFEAAQKFLKKSILGTYLAIKQRKEKTTILQNLNEYSMEKYLLWREMYGSFGNCHIGKFEKVEENFKNEIKLLTANHEEFEEFHALITHSHRRELFKELGINQQNEIKIRMNYDYRQYEPPRRLLFRYDIDAKTKENSPRKAKPMKIQENQNGMKKYFTVEEADNVFFQLCKNGWYRENYNQERRRDCISFAYEFICALHGHNCPAKEVWPENYVSVTEKWSYGSVFASDYGGAHRDFQEEFNKTNQYEKCSIEDFHFQFEIDTAEVADKKILEKLLPVTIHYTTGKYSSTNWRNIVLEDLIEVQEMVQMDNENMQEKIFHKTVLKAYACRVDFKLHAFIKNLKIIKKHGRITGYPLFKVDHLDLYEENKELLHFKLGKDILQMHIPREEEMKETEVV